LELLKQISATDYFNEFALAGGTSLSLQIGHRLSYDLDADLKLFNNVTWGTVKKQILKAVRKIS